MGGEHDVGAVAGCVSVFGGFVLEGVELVAGDFEHRNDAVLGVGVGVGVWGFELGRGLVLDVVESRVGWVAGT